MNEAFLQFVWKHRLFDLARINKEAQVGIEVMQLGLQNRDAGPDFFNALVNIDGTLWAGNVEIHQKASDWYRHQHDKDPAYDNVVLHLVGENDKPVFASNGQEVFTIQLIYPPSLEENYERLMQSANEIPCTGLFNQNDTILLQIWYHALMIERLQQKTTAILERLQQNKNDWNETFYQFLARNFGLKTNALPFEMVARALPSSILLKHKDNLQHQEVLLFGVSGLLNGELVDDYSIRLQEEYLFLSKKYKLKAIDAHLWKFLRLRPVNFPTVRLAQLAALMHNSSGLFSLVLEATSLKQLQHLFDIKASAYWDNHYQFGKPSRKTPKKIGETTLENILVNTIVPFLFIYGEHAHLPFLKDRALDLLEKIQPEKNRLVRTWEQLGLNPRSAFESQALIHLKNSYCETKNCLNCQLGSKLIRQPSRSTQ